MIFYNIKINNMFKFRNFEIDLTVPKTAKNSPILQQHSKYPNIKFRKFVILLGSNASGKTTLGKIICLIQNFVSGKDIGGYSFAKLKDSLANDKKEATWEVVFSNNNKLYLLEVGFNAGGVTYEKWKYINLSNLYYGTLIKELNKSTYKHEIVFDEALSFESYFMNVADLPKFQSQLKGRYGFLYSFSGLGGLSSTDLEDVSEDVISRIMKSFDNSIDKVTKSTEKPGNMVVRFKSGYTELINKDGSILQNDSSILSTGTKESIHLSYLLYQMTLRNRETWYVDEKMSYSHSEIEQQIIQILITLIDKLDGQVFVTSHNSDLLDMNFPNYNFMLLRKNTDGTISEVIQLEKFEKHNDRSLKTIIENDVFSTAPELDELIDLHESFFDNEIE